MVNLKNDLKRLNSKSLSSKKQMISLICEINRNKHGNRVLNDGKLCVYRTEITKWRDRWGEEGKGRLEVT